MQPETAPNSWREWDAGLSSRPVLLKPLSGGRSNRSFLLDSDGRKMVLRINGSEAVLPNSNRASEIEIWRSASDKGIAPPLLHVDGQGRFLVSAYIQDNLPSDPQNDVLIVGRALDLLEKCHKLDVKAPSIDYSRHIELYWKIIEDKKAPVNPILFKQRESMQLVLEDLVNSDAHVGLCHHDLAVENFVGSPERLYLIDWEYAAHGLPVMDYAALSVEWGIEDSIIIEQTDIDLELFFKTKNLYRYLCALWEEASARGAC